MKKSSEPPCGLLNLQAKIYKTVTSLLLYMYYHNGKYIIAFLVPQVQTQNITVTIFFETNRY